jgi:hypothetical protein
MAELRARFAVDGWDERVIEGISDGGPAGPDGGSGPWVGAVEMRKTFTTGLNGTSKALFVSSGDVDGQRSYFAAERITASVGENDRTGSVTVHHGGLESAPDSWFGHVVPHSGTGVMADWSGPARIIHDDEGAFFVFELPD